ncbi:MAG TPA: hypothetical protein DCW68_00265 [Rhodospirillaceae bacterium]|nr:MAG: hypothetical protein A2018_01580 [Alphaproteobacteria bacterium GWF2_58_20]HAU28534.1 hypothetical protein [Rhodospirillaceae bacterium]
MTKSTPFKTATLKNGFRIVVDERPGIGFVKTGIWVKCGSVDEHRSIAGISHFIEHMVFKGTENFSQANIKEIEKQGGESNAYTSYDMTAYHATVFPEHFAKTLDLISDMVLFPTLAHDIDQERGAVLQEIKEYADKSSSVLINAMIRNSFRDQAISWPILGTQETVSA